MSNPVLLTGFAENIWEWLRYADTQLFLKINTEWTHPLLDSIYPWYREANAWVPLYLFLIVFAILNFKEKALPWILFAVLTATLTDQLSSSVIKNLVERPRPCREELLLGQVRLILNNCSGGYSFPSSHATNHFGFAMFLFLTLRPIMKNWGYVFFIWAASIAYGQVYVGVHYPLDILAGSLLGCLIGYLTGIYFNKRIGLPQSE